MVDFNIQCCHLANNNTKCVKYHNHCNSQTLTLVIYKDFINIHWIIFYRNARKCIDNTIRQKIFKLFKFLSYVVYTRFYRCSVEPGRLDDCNGWVQSRSTLIPMTHAPETDAIKSTPFLAPVSGIHVSFKNATDSSGIRFWCRLEHCSIPSQKVACMWLKWPFMIYSFPTYLWL